MLGREQIAQFQAAPWRGPDDVQAWVVAVGEIGRDDLLKLLEIVAKPVGPDDRQRARCFAFSRIAERLTDRQLFVPYVRALKASTGDARAMLVPLIPKVVDAGQIGELCDLVRLPDAALRAAACEALRTIGGRPVYEGLAALVEKDVQGRAEALDALVQVAGPHALPHLQKILLGGKPADKIQVLKLLGEGRFQGKSAGVVSRAIQPALNDGNEQVVQQAVASFATVCGEDDFFGQLGYVFDSPNHVLVRAALEAARRFKSPRVISLLQRKLVAGPNKIRLAVLSILESIATEEILPALVEALGHKHVTVRSAAGEVFVRLTRAGKLDAAPTVVWLLRSKDVNVRRMAAEIARSVKDPNGELWPKLVAFIKDEDWWVRERVLDALVEMAGPALARHFLTYLQDPSDVLRRFAIEVLSRMKERAAIPALLQTSANDTDWWVRERAVEAIASFKDERTVPHLVSLIKRFPDLHLACLDALIQMKGRAAAPHLAPCLGSNDGDVRLAALKCLEVIGEPSLAPMVQPLLADADPKVRKHAALVLTQWNIGIGADTTVGPDNVSRLDRYLVTMAQAEADDFILEAGSRPFVKRLGKVVPMSPTPLTDENVRSMIIPHLTVAQVEDLQALRDVDFSYEVKSEKLRFRANVFRGIGGLSAVFRIIKGVIPALDSLGIPPVVKGLGDLPNGLVLVGGPTGSGKSTTLSALIDYINANYAVHIISLEDPIEAIHSMKKGLVNQREIGTHTVSFSRALRSTLREDPDVILVGEMRDLDTIRFAITAADTGHLVFGTVHTVSADTAVDRLINVFPSSEQQQARSSLANSLRAVICQFLLRRKDGEGRMLASEVMLVNDAIANLIRKGKSFQIPSVIATSKDVGMQAMDADLMRLFKENKVTLDEVYLKARNKKDFEALFPGGTGPAAEPQPLPVPVPGAAAAPATNPRIVAPPVAGTPDAGVRSPMAPPRKGVG